MLHQIVYNFATHKQFPCSCTLAFLCTSWIENSEYAERVVLALTQRKKNATENSRSGGSLGQGFRFSQLALSIACCFFSTPVYSAKNSPENAHFMESSANHHRWTVQVSSIRTIYSLWGYSHLWAAHSLHSSLVHVTTLDLAN